MMKEGGESIDKIGFSPEGLEATGKFIKDNPKEVGTKLNAMKDILPASIKEATKKDARKA